MRIGVVSDSHGDLDRVKRAVEVIGEADVWIHCGDFSQDAKEITRLTGKSVYAVSGNCDGYTDAPFSRVEMFEGKRFFITHGMLHNVNFNCAKLELAALENNCDVALYGHTHISNIEYGRVLIVNPGSVTRPLGGTKASCAIIEINGGKITADICLI